MTVALASSRDSNPHSKDEVTQLAVLLERVREHDRSALRALYDVTSARLMGVAVRVLNDESEAAEVLQEVYLKVWQQASDFSGTGSVLGWLVVVTRNAALDRLKSRRRKREDLTADPDEWQEAVATDGPLELGIQQCLGRLNDHARQAIVLSYIHGYSHQELQERLSRPLGTVKAWIRRGLLELKRCLEA
ncbi:RNA polymerase sigma factor [Saccharospirillum salsuginis]|uniref:RNA polymerase sigma factor n=1 Tax=Saccharospirillum salsuginis TaxID=418750 RepID=A0A918N9Y1_9GAMM|nr:RNA polymerase sigma factor [Saccharospirillum salsuginis]